MINLKYSVYRRVENYQAPKQQIIKAPRTRAWSVRSSGRTSPAGRRAGRAPRTGAVDMDLPAPYASHLNDQVLHPPTEYTTCSECGVDLDSSRSVCSTCEEKASVLLGASGREDASSRATAAAQSEVDVESGTGKGKDIYADFDPSDPLPPTHRATPSSYIFPAAPWSSPSDTALSNKPLPPRPLPATLGFAAALRHVQSLSPSSSPSQSRAHSPMPLQ